MKTIKILLAILFFFAQIGYSQQLVQNLNDMYRLKEYEAIFVNKPLKDLIKEIKPEIKIAFPYSHDPSFDFRFVTHEQLRKRQGTIAENVALFVDVKETIDWNWETRPKGKEPVWTKEDAEKYGNLIVTRINLVY
ncbi:hypothetical protein [Flavobacterium sp. FlaQc-47]|uniref:hypothetical protein n=1 Tax=Flavobacterium sp. FlaQc-47 TaxID=3374180 RepID=UPI0037575448